MEILKLIILLCCTYCMASKYSHVIPVENYETELQVLDEHVEIPEPPVKIIKVTKTVAVKIPVPYPVKVVEKVPYPVHVAKPYPVPVTQIVHVPQPAHKSDNQQQHPEHGSFDVQHEQFQQQHPGDNSGSQEEHEDIFSFPSGPEHSYGGNSNANANFRSDAHSPDGDYGAPVGYNGYASNRDDNASFESKNFNKVIRQYIHKQMPNNNENSNSFHYQ